MQSRLGVGFHNPALLQLALSHRSSGANNNERLEFLGDAILGATIAEYLYRKFPDAAEGKLSRVRSRLVRAESLGRVAQSLDLGQFLILGPGELRAGGHNRESILGDTLEALIGAVYLDKGMAIAQQCICRWFADELASISLETSAKDAKTALQEWLQQHGYDLPDYQLVAAEGAAHQRIFTVSCQLPILPEPVQASARSRRGAEQQVARQLLDKLEEINDREE